MKNLFLYSICCFFILESCGQRLSGDSEQDFKASRLKVEKELNLTEKENLEKALGVIVLQAMSEKWNTPEKYKKQSFNEISMKIIDGKTYDDVITLAEDYLRKEKKKDIASIQDKIEALKKEKAEASNVISLLEKIKPGKIEIVEGSWDIPQIRVRVVNESDSVLAGGYEFQMDILSISKNIKVDGVGTGGSFKPNVTIEPNENFTSLSRSLASLMEKSKRLNKLLQNTSYPINDLSKYDLKIKITPLKLTTAKGFVYEYPKRDLETISREIEGLKAELEIKQKLKGSLEELEIKAKSQKNVYNQKYLNQLETIRNKANPSDTQIVKIDINTRFSFPKKYEIIKRKHPGYYTLSLDDSLIFDNQDQNLIQFQIRDTTYVEYEDKYDKENGILNVLADDYDGYDIQETIHSMKETAIFADLIDTDSTGYIYFRNNKYHMLRYIEVNSIHYAYSMTFPTLRKCVLEFDRSRNFMK